MKRMKRIAAVLTAAALVSGASAPVFSGGEGVIQCAAAAEAPADVVESLSSELRAHMTARETDFSIIVPREYISSENINTIIISSLEDTGKGNEGDYLRWNISRYSYSGSAVSNGFNIRFKVEYDTTAEQEKAVDAEIKRILSALDIGSGSEYDRIAAAYDYVVENVEYADSYDFSRSVVYTAYGAAVEGSAVCQGYAMLLYRLLRELGINCRAIPGNSGGGSHMWNIAEIGGKYYLLDCTYDSTLGNRKGNYCYFLKGSKDFDLIFPDYSHEFALQNPGSTLIAELARDDFFTLHPISLYEYDPASAPAVTTTVQTTVPTSTTTTSTTTIATKPSGEKDPGTISYILGDVDDNGVVSSSDASLVMAAYAEQSTNNSISLTYVQQLAADVNKDGIIDSSDASNILRYYAYRSTGGQDEPESYFKQIGG